jgi:ABC-type polysaccharide/polyol phosphate export permease
MRFVTRAGFFVSPVMWTAEMAMERGSWGEAALWNPMVLPITMVRHGLEGKSVDLPVEIIASSLIVTMVLYLLGTIIFSRYERQAVKYL